MPAYLIADTHITDHATYDEYKRQVAPLIAKFGGRFLVRGGAHEVLEGTWQPARLVVIEFPDMDAEILVQLSEIRAFTGAAPASSNRSPRCGAWRVAMACDAPTRSRVIAPNFAFETDAVQRCALHGAAQQSFGGREGVNRNRIRCAEAIC